MSGHAWKATIEFERGDGMMQGCLRWPEAFLPDGRCVGVPYAYRKGNTEGRDIVMAEAVEMGERFIAEHEDELPAASGRKT